MLKIGLIQMEATPLQTDKNLAHAAQLITEVVKQGAQLVVLPEMFNVGFFLGESLMNVAENIIDDKTVTWLKQQANQYQVYIITSIYEKFEGHFYNTMLMVGHDGSVQHYRKRNPTFTEITVWRRSDVPGPGIFDTPFGRVGGAICADSFAKESFVAFQKSQVDLVIVPACWGAPSYSLFRPEMVLTTAATNRWSYLASEVMTYQYAKQLDVPVVFSNISGRTYSPLVLPAPYSRRLKDTPIDMYGHSLIRNANGDKIAGTDSSTGDYYVVATVDVKPKLKKPKIERIDLFPNYLRSSYYFIQPPLLVKFVQWWSYHGYNKEYEARRLRHI